MKVFTVEFMGLCACVVTTADKNTHATVLLVEHDMHPHYPRLIVDLASLTSDDDVAIFDETSVGSIGWLDLSGYDVRIRPDDNEPAPDRLDLEVPKASMSPCPAGANKNNLAWLVDLNTLTGIESRSDLTDDAALPAAVACRFFLSDGDLLCCGHASRSKKVQKFWFGQGKPRAIADATRYDLTKKATHVILELKLRRTIPGSTDLSISFDSPAGVIVSNGPSPTDIGDPEHHFQAFRRLLASDPGQVGLMEDQPCEKAVTITKRYPPRKPCPQTLLTEKA